MTLLSYLRCRRLYRIQNFLIAIILLSSLCGIILGISFIMDSDKKNANKDSKKEPLLLEKIKPELNIKSKDEEIKSDDIIENNDRNQDSDNNQINDDVKPKNKINRVELPPVELEQFPVPNYDVHVFYYPWYGNVEVDGQYLHWDHEFLQHWDKKIAAKWPKGKHQPPDDIGSNYYPRLGTYSSRDPKTMESHMEQIRSAGIGVLAVSWYPPDEADGQGNPWDEWMPQLFDYADRYELKVAFHIEPFNDRSPETMQKYVQYIINKYGKHNAFYRKEHNGKTLPLFYIYDSYMIPSNQWKKLLTPQGPFTVRETKYDSHFIGLIVERNHRDQLTDAGFDGMYTYFASDGFSFGSSITRWKQIAEYAKSKDLLFIPSVGPGYIDEKIRPWNHQNTKDRKEGDYYLKEFDAAIAVEPPLISITSFNEWHEGSQIELAVPKIAGAFKYVDYLPHGPDFYLKLTEKSINKYKTKMDMIR
ncbi:unnamed protein product [Owenia fusiformis]|uniref:Uncharacterized protein n=1 Tax=Owenia fusiformis TaxID=6347 RepID=A0A8J1XIZ8_OWEFU|nr:unnamed protein product [Owenia fusiformis]